MKIEVLSYTVPVDGQTIEKLIERIGRVSHKSEDKISDESTEDFLKMILKMKHDALWEFADFTVLVSDVSRAMTHQLVRHRLVSYMQESQRHVEPNGYVTPYSLKEGEVATLYAVGLQMAFNNYEKLLKAGIPKEDARFVLPNATHTRIVVKANLREWLHIIDMRGAPDAQWEIREFAIEMLRLLKRYAPTVFGHYRIVERDGKKIIVKGLIGK